MDSIHLQSLGNAGHEAASRVLTDAPDLSARWGSAPVDLHSLRVSTARRAHQLAHAIDDRADALAPTHSGDHRWRKRFLVLAAAGAAAFYLSRKLTRGKPQSPQVNEPPVDIRHEDVIADGASSEAAPGAPTNAMATTPGTRGSSNGARSKKAEAK
jgi:hypothetical protein